MTTKAVRIHAFGGPEHLVLDDAPLPEPVDDEVLLPPSRSLAADRAYDSDAFRRLLLARGTRPVIPNGPRRTRLHLFDPVAYKRRNLVERAFCRLKDFRRVATHTMRRRVCPPPDSQPETLAVLPTHFSDPARRRSAK